MAKTTAKSSKKDYKKWGVRILVILLALTFIVSTLITVIPALFI
ncbi:MAG: hypothetical protein ACI4RV_00345 [Eubacteriales bacterium]